MIVSAAVLLLLLLATAAIFLYVRLVRSSPPRFLSRRQAQAVFRSASVRRMIATMSFRECVARSSGRVVDRRRFRAAMLDAYVQGADEFTAGEVRVLNSLIRSEPIFGHLDVGFIKMRPGLDWGLPYTIADCIVLPPGFCSRGDARKTLAHEAVHVLQRRHQREFDDFYIRRWHFLKAARVHLPRAVADRSVVNPDSPRADWLYRVPDGTLYWLNMEVSDAGRPSSWAYVAYSDKDSYRVPSADDRVPLASLARHFQGVTAATSPNEVFAYLYPEGGVKLSDVALPGWRSLSARRGPTTSSSTE